VGGGWGGAQLAGQAVGQVDGGGRLADAAFLIDDGQNGHVVTP
jgi:hypothetical protein